MVLLKKLASVQGEFLRFVIDSSCYGYLSQKCPLRKMKREKKFKKQQQQKVTFLSYLSDKEDSVLKPFDSGHLPGLGR